MSCTSNFCKNWGAMAYVKKEKAEHFRRSALFSFRVKDGVRTRDLRNHNPAL